MEMTLDECGCIDENHNDVPQTVTVEDSALVTPLIPLKDIAQHENHRSFQLRKTTGFSDLQDSNLLGSARSRPRTFLDKNQMILESIEESPGSRAQGNRVEESKDTDFAQVMNKNC